MSSSLQFSEVMSGAGMPGFNVMLFGKTGSGKSSLGNMLVGEKDKFEVESGLSSGTKNSKWEEVSLDGVNLKITDVPGLSDTHVDEKIILKQTAESVALVAPGPHAILFVISVGSGRRFTKEEHDAYLKVKELFTDRICDFMIVIFTSVDSLKTTKGNRVVRLNHALQNAPNTLREVLDGVSNRYIGVENEADDTKEQRKDVIRMIQEVYKKNKGQHYVVPEEINRLLEQVVEKRAAKDGCSKEMATQIVKREIQAGKHPELVHGIEKEASKKGWWCTIL